MVLPENNASFSHPVLQRLRREMELLRRTTKQEGFTLVELLVVIAILGILAALILAGVAQVKARAFRIQCVNNLRQQGIGLQGYVADNSA